MKPKLDITGKKHIVWLHPMYSSLRAFVYTPVELAKKSKRWEGWELYESTD